jgi:hypothetical protein
MRQVYSVNPMWIMDGADNSVRPVTGQETHTDLEGQDLTT